jgi:hypothetical protein
MRSIEQTQILKLIRYLAYVFTPVLTEALAVIRSLVPSRMKPVLADPRTRREFAKLVTECVREALAHPGLIGPAMVRRCIDTWVGVYSSVLEEPVTFHEIESHLMFAIALSGCKSVRFPTGSFWFAVLNRLVDWERAKFIEDYFKTILENGVVLFDKELIIQFVANMKEDETLVEKLGVLKVIVVMLKGNEMLREALKETWETLGPLVEVVDGDDSILDPILEAMTDPD